MGSNLEPGSSVASPDVRQHNRDAITGASPVRVRKLVQNLPSKVVFRKVHEAERMAAAGERELGFYLLEVQRRSLHREVGSTTFNQFLKLRTGTPVRKARELIAIARKLEDLPTINNAFADGILFWTAVRAIVTVAKPEDEHEWVEFARKNTVRAVEKRVASCKRGDGPREKRWDGSSVRFTHRFNATPELHQLIVSWQEVLSKRWERAVTEEEAYEYALQTAMKVEIQADDDDAREGKVRKLPSGYRLVVLQTSGVPDGGVPGDEAQFWVALPDGPVRIDAATARRLLEGAEVLDLRSCAGLDGPEVQPAGGAAIDERQKHPHVAVPSPPDPPRGGEILVSQVVAPQGAIFGVPEGGPGPANPADLPQEPAGPAEPESDSEGKNPPEGAARLNVADVPPAATGNDPAEGAETAIDERKKHPHVGDLELQVVSPPGPIFGVPERAPAPATAARPSSTVPCLPLWAKAAPLVPTDPGMRIQHAPNLCALDGPTVPPEERAPRSSPELIKQVLSREGYFCAIPGCTNMAEIAHHIVFHSQGGPTNLLMLIAVCRTCHDAGIHKGYLLVSGTAGNLIISGKDGLPLTAGAAAYPPSVKLEVEPVPRPEQSGAGVVSEVVRLAVVPALVIPAEISPAWWLEHRHLFEWSERLKALVVRPDRDPVGEAVAFEDPPPAPPAGPSAPEGLDGFIGQAAVVKNLKMLVAAAKLRGEVPPPALLAGPPGLGKTTLANLAARELGTRIQVAAGPALADLLALVRILVSLKRGDVLFIDEIHALPTPVAECFYQALDGDKTEGDKHDGDKHEGGTVSIPIITGTETRLVKLRLEPFFLIGATTEEAGLPKPLHSRFALRERLDLYSTGELAAIALARGKALGVEVTPEAADNFARASRGTPRQLLSVVSMARDEAQVAAGRPDGVVITGEFAEKALRSLGIDRFGLLEIERKILLLLHEKGGRLSLRTLADLLGESPKTLLEVHEPYLLRAGWILRTHRGRVLTDRARQVVVFGLDGRKMPEGTALSG